MGFEIGQKVYLGGGYRGEIYAISKYPYIEFDDGSKHYVMTVILDSGDFISVNDAQIEVIEHNGN